MMAEVYGLHRLLIDPLERFRPAVDDRLTQVFADKAQQAAAIDPLYGELLTDMGRFIARGGKRLRPYLVYLGYRGYGGRSEAILDVAAGMELFHNFLLIHDDIMDRDLKRYGGPNLSALYRQRFRRMMKSAAAKHYAEAIAVLAGDINCGLAYELMMAADFPPEHLLAVAQRVHRMIFEVAGGQQLDVLIPILHLTADVDRRLNAVIQHKTAGYSFAAPLQIGAILANAPQSELDLIEKMATPLGSAFQLRDDLLGMFGNEGVLGKSTLSDLREGKRTALSHLALKTLHGADLERLQKLLGNPKVTYTDLDWVRQVMESSGIRAQIEQRARAEAEQANVFASQLGTQPQAREQLVKLIDYTVRREL